MVVTVAYLTFSLAFMQCTVFADTQEANKNNKAPSAKSTKVYPSKVDLEQRLNLHDGNYIIENIYVDGNIVVSKNAILAASTLKIGNVFNVHQTASTIKNLYKLKYFHHIKIFAEPIEEKPSKKKTDIDQDKDDETKPRKVNLYIVVQEKPKVNNISFTGNKALTEKDLKEQLNTEDIKTLVEEELKPIITKIKKIYHKKNYHNVKVTAKLVADKDKTVSAEFTIVENKKSYLNRISFKGNKHITGKQLKRIMYSQEDWILSFVNRAGVYNNEMLEADKYMIETAYRNNGFINAKVVNVEAIKNTDDNHFHIIFTIIEGERYRIKEIIAEGNDVVPSERVRSVIPIYEGQLYSSEAITTALDNLRILWGEFGYIFADIEPNISLDDENKTVSITFNTDLKDQVYLNRITLRGNKKTRDKVIRRQILLEEGELITNQKMEVSKACVGLLGYFDPKNGVAWKTTRIDNTHADLDLMLTEVKTGSFSVNLSFGGSPTKQQTPQTGLTGNISFGDRNFLGSGIAVAGSADVSQKFKSFQGSLSNPWLFDRPIRGSMAGFIKSSEYDDEVNFAENPPVENVVGGAFGIGYVSKLLGSVTFDANVNVECITYTTKQEAAKRLSAPDRIIADVMLEKYFKNGNQISFIANLSKDIRNGSVFPTNGYQWSWQMQYTLPGWKRNLNPTDCCLPIQNNCSNFHYFRTEFDTSFYTPLVGEHDLILCLHGKVGIIQPLKSYRNGIELSGDIPWKNLYHIGGPTTIRAYTYGQVGPTWKEDSLGASKALCFNAEFIIPVSANLNTRAVIFYDGGAAWDTPYLCAFQAAAKAVGQSFDKDLANNNFFYRHSVGVGVRLKSPSPMQVDFGIKLNPSKRYRKHLTELHFNMDHSF